MTKKVLVVVGGVCMTIGLLAACGTYRAERQGKQLGDAICSLKHADANSVDNAANKVQRQADDLQRIVGRPFNEDVKDIQNNLSDLRQHVVDGNSALIQQDIAVIQRNVQAVGRTLSGRAKSAYFGILEGLNACGYH